MEDIALGTQLNEPLKGYKRIYVDNDIFSYPAGVWSKNGELRASLTPNAEISIQINYNCDVFIMGDTWSSYRTKSVEVFVNDVYNGEFTQTYPNVRTFNVLCYIIKDLKSGDVIKLYPKGLNNANVAMGFHGIDFKIKRDFLIQQGVEVYSIDHNYIKLGEPVSDQQLNQWFELYGYEDIGILLEDSTRRTVSSQKEQDVYETRSIDFNKFLGNVEIKELTDTSDNVSYDSSPFKILDDIKQINNGKFNVLVKK
ncbi:hypothetical protein KQI86_03875 [Clostridium sp. MSJ-11]|uniref:Uncharacterized protein n=1 Tax=Clostridium mobile TaxID=2841512 RepID=A0ABS6EE17_9CLOT|nr:hypothetical protein [Clostridium mobile]MBU5483454.1 hypothetical protein [Clostridium mobile]